MKRFLSLAMAFCVAVTLSLDVNAAKRFGGGKSMGSAPRHQTRQVQPNTAPNTPNAAAPAAGAAAGAAAAGGASRWLGPLAGIAAGGLLASMFMGDGFQGMQFLDILIIALIAFIAFRFIASRRRQQAQGQPAMAGHAPQQREMPAAQPSPFGASARPAAAAPAINAPSWFDEQRFVSAAREHFLSLQQHWDANEMDKIAEFVTPQMLQWLKQERAELGDGYQSTYIDNLQVQLEGVDDQADKTIATLTFSGLSKTSRFDQGETFSESWRMERAQGQDQPWLLAGIRQNG
ncbi:Tim44 domain-containing protein [Pseudomonas citronellolis]|uniref:Tim44 domain-containing protein n=1 Tax=Pseudomonas citronellolis TaxID=53408 RepID=UPI0018D79AD1|nr:TIM44-like domain-containing protein [Pseudomonas citronellolis]MBH3436902.1 TIM44-like domain-containing protein [Pseudomonas citronellolis]